MHPHRQASLGFALGGVGLLGGVGASVGPFGLQDWMSGSATTGLGLFVAAAGVAGIGLRHGHGVALLAAGMGVALAGAVADLGFTLAWAGRTPPLVAAQLVVAVGLAQAAWFAVLWATEPSEGMRRVFGLRLGVGAAALGTAAAMVVEFLDGSSAVFVLPLVVAAAGLALAARAPLEAEVAAHGGAQGGAAK